MHRFYTCTILFYIGDTSVQGLSDLFMEARHGGTCRLYFCLCVCVWCACVYAGFSIWGWRVCMCVLIEVNIGCLSIALHFNLRQGF